VAPGYAKKGVSQGGGGNAGKLGPAPRWTTPLLGFGEEEVKGTSLQPFANLRGNGTVYHTGLDVGSSLDGAGYYASADGYVRLVHSGSDMGTLIVLQHCYEPKKTVNAVYMHGGDTVFVKGGQKVEAGQLLGTMGMGYSIENGGHFAHLHFGMYPGSYSDGHNYGYKSVKAGLADWFDPAEFLPRWIERTRPLAEVPATPDPVFDRAVELVRSGEYGKGYGEAQRVLTSGGATAEQQLAGAGLQKLLEDAMGDAVKRATAQRDAGYPAFSMQFLRDHAARCKGIPGSETLAATAKEWSKDPAFKKALQGEGKIASTEAKAAKLAGKKGAEAKIAALWKGLLDKYGDTCLKPRLEEILRSLEAL
jgi:hypothetical protein